MFLWDTVNIKSL